jgi:hypothetical protein
MLTVLCSQTVKCLLAIYSYLHIFGGGGDKQTKYFQNMQGEVSMLIISLKHSYFRRFYVHFGELDQNIAVHNHNKRQKLNILVQFCRTNVSKDGVMNLGIKLYNKKKLHGLSPRVNYTDRATAACR